MSGLRHIDASGALVVVYHMDGAEPELLMGEESKFVSDDKGHVAKYARDFGKSIFDAFTYKGDIKIPADVEKAHEYFAKTAAARKAVFGITWASAHGTTWAVMQVAEAFRSGACSCADSGST